ncbi:MAG: glycoside hydrolase family 3 N-terminal domain-containing protein [Pyrinomonadaceae bacterium]
MIEQLRSLTLEQKIGQLFFIGIGGADVDTATEQLLEEVSPGGICLFARNIREAQQTRNLLDAIRERSAIVPFLSIDQEGGLVDRLRRVQTPMPAADKIKTVDKAEELGSIVADSLKNLGFNMDFAPVVDVIDEARAGQSNGLLSREFGRSQQDVVGFAGAFLTNLQNGGIIGCLKHFPGLGASKVDSHEELPQVLIEEDEFSNVDLFPYRELLKRGDIHAIMAAHAAFPRLNLQEKDENGKLLPSSLSKNFISTLLRGLLGYNGLVITDDLEMGAIVRNYGIGEACKMAVNAAVDMLAICADADRIREGYNAVRDSVQKGEISETRIDQSLIRIAAVKSLLAKPVEFDQAAVTHLSERITALSENLSRS